MIRRPYQAATLLVASMLLAAPAIAQDSPTAAVRELLSHLPMTPPGGKPSIVGYLDVTALAVDGPSLAIALRTAAPPEMLQTPLAMEDQQPGGFGERAGFGPDRIERIAFFEDSAPGPAPAVLRLKDVDADALTRIWVRRGYVQDSHGPFHAWIRGTPGQLQLDQQDPADPFRNRLGVSSALDLDGPLLLLAPDVSSLELMKSAPPGVGGRIDIRRLLDGLDKTLQPTETLTQLRLLMTPDAAGDAAFEAATGAMAQPGAAGPAAVKDAFTGANGIPSYPALLIGELRAKSRGPQGILALLWSDCAIADAAGKVAAAKWQVAAGDAQNRAKMVFGRLSPAWSSVPVDGGCVLLGRVTGTDPAAAPPFLQLVQLTWNRALSPLQVGRAPKP
ncbi:hypothetical protein AB4093_01175 [Inquilinus sp. 2KB_12]|uniref:hypothetical protein n=1 Tax=Inquilinus sp. 2KB_12 TaxID=3232975 RepID=UPI003F8EB461